jgi:multidrug efflux pump subunit AcrA (membrane-fusion protein)
MTVRTLAIYTLVVILMALVSCLAQPAGAQSSVTPTPRPAYEATRTAAQAQIDAARQQQAEADRLDAQAAEMRRNADIQQQAAQQAIDDARAAAIAQDAVRTGEAIGRAENELTQLRASLDGIAQINAGNVATVKAQADQIVSLTNEVQQLRTALKVAQDVNAANQQRIAQAQAEVAPSPVVSIFAALAFVALIGIIVILVAEKWRARGMSYAADGDVIDIEPTTAQEEGQWTG